MTLLESLGISFLIGYFLINIYGIFWIAFQSGEGWSGKVIAMLICLWFGTLVLISVALFENAADNYIRVKSLIKNAGIDIKSLILMEKKLVEQDLMFVDSSGKQHKITGDLRKEIGLSLNKHLTNNYSRGIFDI